MSIGCNIKRRWNPGSKRLSRRSNGGPIGAPSPPAWYHSFRMLSNAFDLSLCLYMPMWYCLYCRRRLIAIMIQSCDNMANLWLKMFQSISSAFSRAGNAKVQMILQVLAHRRQVQLTVNLRSMQHVQRHPFDRQKMGNSTWSSGSPFCLGIYEG